MVAILLYSEGRERLGVFATRPALHLAIYNVIEADFFGFRFGGCSCFDCGGKDRMSRLAGEVAFVPLILTAEGFERRHAKHLRKRPPIVRAFDGICISGEPDALKARTDELFKFVVSKLSREAIAVAGRFIPIHAEPGIVRIAKSDLRIKVDLALIVPNGDLLDCKRVGGCLRLLTCCRFVLLSSNADLSLE